MKNSLISSWKDAQAIAPTAVKRLNADPVLMLAAAANPILALRRLGYDIAPLFLEEFQDRLRFGPRGAVRLRQLRTEIFAQLGYEFELQSPAEVERVLRDRLGMDDVPSGAPTFSLKHDVDDPLECAHGRHPVIAAILEFRRLNARAPELAPPDLFEELLAGKHQLPELRLHARFHSRIDGKSDKG